MNSEILMDTMVYTVAMMRVSLTAVATDTYV